MNFMRRKIRFFIAGLACIACLLCVCQTRETKARDLFTASYIQTLYNQNNGIGSNEVNCVYQSKSGYIWVGTDGGLFRSDGSGFSPIYLWDDSRADLYSIRCVTQDSTGCMWIGTGNYGLFYYENGSTGHFRNEYYNGVKEICDICENENGTVYVATADGLFLAGRSVENIRVLNAFPEEEIAEKKFEKLCNMGEEVWALYGGRYIYVLGDDGLKYVIDLTKITEDEVTCMKLLENQVYCGTASGKVLVFSSYERYETYETQVLEINALNLDAAGRIWVGAENGIGYINENREFVRTPDMKINSYITDILQDYEGNYWISSWRTGLLFLARSKFTDFNMQNGMPVSMVNCAFKNGGVTYVGTDSGLLMYSGGERISGALNDFFGNSTIRDIQKDVHGNLWISTVRSFGLVRVDASGEAKRAEGSSDFPSTAVNATYVLNSGRVLVGTERGLALVDSTGGSVSTFNEKHPLYGVNILSLYQDTNGLIYVGTDGRGLFTFYESSPDDMTHYSVDDGLNSNVITALKASDLGLYIATDDGLCFYNETFRAISTIEHSNSIYDLEFSNGYVWMAGSKGILRATEEELLGSDELSNRYLTSDDGLNRELNAMGHSYIDENGIYYICCNDGLYTLDTANIPLNETEPRIKVTAIDVDGKKYEFNDLGGELSVPADASRLAISFAIYSYSNRANMEVEYRLTGFDDTPIVVGGNDTMEAVYTNLAGGEYFFEISARNGDGTSTAAPVSFTITKQRKFFERRASRVVVIGLGFFALLALTTLFIHVRNMLTRKNRELETLAKEHEEVVKYSSAKTDYLANMSNEIKTPINAMMAKADEIIKVMSEDDTNRENVQGIYDIGGNILSRVDDIILLAKLEAGSINTVQENYSISTLIYEVSEYAVKKLGEKNVKYLVEIGDVEKDYVSGDMEKVREVLERLVDYSISNTKDGSVTLSVDCYIYNDDAHKNTASVVFTVTDTGVGIPEEQLGDIFNIYMPDKKKSKSTGSGLPIAKGYADLLGGDLSCESVYGAGTTFTFSLDQMLSDAYSKQGSGAKIEGKVSQEIAESLWLPEVSVLLVDDDDVSLELSEKHLKTFEMKVDTAKNGMAAIDMVMNHEYDVVFMDVSMPVMNGVDAMKEIRELSDIRFQTLPIIAMDEDAIESNRDELIARGFTDSLVKPLDIRRLAALLKDCLPESKISEKSPDINKYIAQSRYGEGLKKLTSVLEIDRAIEKIGGSIEVYNKLIVAFFQRNSKAVSEVMDKIETDKHGLKTRIHSIRMGCNGIGAFELAKETGQMESAISRSDKDYIRRNVDIYTDHLSDLLLMIEDYLGYMYSVSGMTDEEYAKLRKEERQAKKEAGNTETLTSEKTPEKPEEKTGIDVTVLADLRLAALDGDEATLQEKADILARSNVSGEDADFLEALFPAIKSKDIKTIDELVTTYMDLKI